MEEFTEGPAATAKDKYFGNVRTANLFASNKYKSLNIKFGMRQYFEKTFLSIDNFTRGAKEYTRRSKSDKRFTKQKPGPAEASGILKEGDVILEVVPIALSVCSISWANTRMPFMMQIGNISTEHRNVNVSTNNNGQLCALA